MNCQSNTLAHASNAPAVAASQVYETPGRAMRRLTTTAIDRNNKTNVIKINIATYFTS